MSGLLDLRVLLGMAAHTLRDPQGGARMIIGLGVPVPVLWQFYLLQLVLSAMIKLVVFSLFTPPEMELGSSAALSFTALEAAIGVGLVIAIHRIGRGFGGAGDFAGSLAIVIWLQFILLCVNVLQMLVIMVLPPAGDVITLLALALFFWLLAQFIAALHGFASIGRVFLGIVLCLLALAFAFNIILALMGIRVG